MKRKTFLALESYMYRCMCDSAHDREHIYRVLNNALKIAEGESGVDMDVLVCACLLHDIGRQAQLQDPTLCHAAVGSRMAYDHLLEEGFTVEFAEKVSSCIRTHRFRKDDPPGSPEAKILFDADKLDVVGAIGIARTLAYQGTVSAPMYSRRPDGTVSEGTEDPDASFFREYHFKLKKLYGRFYTEKGAALAAERRESAVRFYEDLLREVKESAEGSNALARYLDEE